MADEVIDAVEAVDTAEVETPVGSSAPAATAGPDRNTRINALVGAARDHYRMTGDVEAAEAMVKKPDAADNAEKADSSTADDEDPETSSQEGTVKTEPAPGPGNTEQPKSKRQQFSELRDAKIRAEAERDLLRKQLEDARKGAPAKADEKPALKADTPIERPKRPRYADYDDGKAFDDAWDKYETDLDSWNSRTVDERVNGVRREAHQSEFQKAYQGRVKAAKDKIPDYDKYAQANVSVSYGMAEFLLSEEDGPLVQYALGKNTAEAERISKLSVIPGEDKFQTLSEFHKWIKSDPDRAMLYGEKRAIIRIELAKLKVPAAKAAPNPKPLKEIIAATSQPSAEVNTDGETASTSDPIQAALKRGDFSTYKRLMNAKEERERRGI